ncbi:MAG: hypothetical protein CBC42_07895 [Betaproteobacteria bacterium TMED82]|nr:MAG: hypothetical protein CBC42_07895 [Betaproteobacteria bacterium TMED82]|tara:strand:- start:140 stop:490 length:351 start_codon:yes stop_codon:yes gene_type:complete
MSYFLIKVFLSGFIVALISEATKKSPALGALIASLPILSLLAIIWIWFESGDAEKISKHTESTFWLVLPSLPMFLVLPNLLRSGWNIWFSLGISIILTFILYLITIRILRVFGITM